MYLARRRQALPTLRALQAGDLLWIGKVVMDCDLVLDRMFAGGGAFRVVGGFRLALEEREELYRISLQCRIAIERAALPAKGRRDGAHLYRQQNGARQ